VTFIESSAVGVLFGVRNQAASQAKRFRVVGARGGPSPSLERQGMAQGLPHSGRNGRAGVARLAGALWWAAVMIFAIVAVGTGLSKLSN
jgi:hypothetical protein